MRIATGRDLALAIRSARLAAGLTQQDLADAAGVSRQWVVSVEAQRSNPGVLTVLTVLAALQMGMNISGTIAADHGDIDLDAVLARHTGLEDD